MQQIDTGVQNKDPVVHSKLRDDGTAPKDRPEKGQQHIILQPIEAGQTTFAQIQRKVVFFHHHLWHLRRYYQSQKRYQPPSSSSSWPKHHSTHFFRCANHLQPRGNKTHVYSPCTANNIFFLIRRLTILDCYSFQLNSDFYKHQPPLLLHQLPR